MGNRQSNNSLPPPESDEMQPKKRQRIMDEQSIVIYDQEQGSSSSSQLICHLDMLPSNSALSPKIESLKEKLGRLFARRSDVLTELEVAELQPGQKQREEVCQWLTEVQRIENKIQSMRNDGQGLSSNSNLSGSVESFIKEIDELVQRSKFPNGFVLLDQESTRLPLSQDIKPVGTKFQENTKKILELLRNHERCIIGVYGMGGVGKTTLLTHIHDQLLKDSNLSQEIGLVYWVTVSQNCPVHKLQKDIAKALGVEDIKEDDERKRAAVLRNIFAKRGQTVLILDDMWEQVSGSKVGIPLENGNCKIILSTRSNDVCRKMGCKDLVIKAETLNEGEAWDLFVEKLGDYDTLEEEAKKIAWDITKECGGLPLAIATIARSMTNVADINEWKTALNDLKSARDPADMKEDVFRILQYSYDRLNDKRVQNCFLSCLLYEEDVKIQRTTLIDLWINEGLLDDIKIRDAQVAKGHVILNKLESSCLLESSVLNYGKEKCVKMHDLIRDMGIMITKEHPLFIAEARKQLEQVPEEEKWSKDLVKVSLIHNEIEEIPSGMAPMTPNLTVLMLTGNPLEEIPDSFFVNMKALTVLDLSGTQIERVPESVSDLENLRGLLLAYCESLIYVPSVEKLTKLRTLDLHGCWGLEEAPRGLERLKCVETVGFIPWDVSNVIGFNEVIQSLTSLSHYGFWIWDSTSSKPFYEIEMLEEYEKVVLMVEGKFGEGKKNCLLPTSLNCLGIIECDVNGRSLGDVFQSLGEATGVKYIIIKGCRGLESILGTQQGSSLLCTTELRILKLENLPDLKSIANLGTPHPFFRLQELEINGCPKLKVVLPVTCHNQLHLPNLESIWVSDCDELEEIFELKVFESLGCLPKLKTLSLWDLPKVKIIFPMAEQLQSLVCLPKLERLSLGHLPKVKMIFPLTEQLQLPGLSSIYVNKCEELEEISGSNKVILSSHILSLSLPNLENLSLQNLPKIKVKLKQFNLSKLKRVRLVKCGEVEEMFGVNKATLFNPLLALSSLEHLKLCSLSKIKVIFPKMKVVLPVTCKMELHLPGLKSIEIEDCEEVEEVFESNKAIILTELYHLKLYRLPRIKVIFPFTKELHPNLASIDVRECKEVEEIFGTNKATLTSNPIFSLPNLTDLHLTDLPKLKVNLKQFNLPKLRRIVLKNCEVEEVFESNKATLDNPPLPLSNLRHLEFCSLSTKIKVIFPFTEQSHVQNLTTIVVSNCKEVEEIFESSKATPWNPILALPNLESIQLNDLPNLRSIWNGMPVDIPKLRILDVHGCWKLEEARSRELERLKWVERVSYMPWDVSSDRIRFDKVMQSLASLSFYRILIGDGDPTFLCQSFDKWRGFYMYEKEVWIRGGEFGEDKSSFVLPTTLKCLRIDECDMKGRCLGDVFQAEGLKQIVLSKCRGLDYLLGAQHGSLLSYVGLNNLILTGLPDLRSIAEFGTSSFFLFGIRRLYISNCPRIKVVLPFLLETLEIIEVKECHKVEEIFEANKTSPNNPPTLALRNLQSLKLEGLPNLRSICKGVLLDVPKLDKMLMALQDRDNRGLCRYLPGVRNCPMLKLSLFPGGLVGDQPDNDDITEWGAFLSPPLPVVSFPFNSLEH